MKRLFSAEHLPALSALVDQMSAGFVYAEYPSGNFVIFNEASEKIIGHPMIRSTGLRDLEVYGAVHEDGTRFKNEDYPMYRSLFLDEDVNGKEYSYIRGDGKKICLTCSTNTVYDSNGNKIGVTCIFQDVTNLKDLQRESVKRHETCEKTLAEFNVLFSSLPFGVAFFDENFRYLRVNEKLAKINNLPLEAHIGKTVAELFPQAGPEADKIIKQVFTTGVAVEELDVYLYNTALSKEILSYTISFYPVTNDGRIIGVAGILKELTPARNSDLVLRRTLDEVEKEKTIISDYLRSVQEDVMAPITSIKLNTQLLGPSVNNQKKLGSIAVKIQDSLVKLNNYISDMLNFLSIQADQSAKTSSDVDLVELIEGTAEDINSQYRHTFKLHLPEEYFVKGDREELKRLLNLFMSFGSRFGSSADSSELSFVKDGKNSQWSMSVTDMNLLEEDLMPLMVSTASVSILQNPLNTKAMALLFARKIAESHSGRLFVERKGDSISLRLQLPQI